MVGCPGSHSGQGQGCREWEHESLEMLTGKAPDVDPLPDPFTATQKIRSTKLPWQLVGGSTLFWKWITGDLHTCMYVCKCI